MVLFHEIEAIFFFSSTSVPFHFSTRSCPLYDLKTKEATPSDSFSNTVQAQFSECNIKIYFFLTNVSTDTRISLEFLSIFEQASICFQALISFGDTYLYTVYVDVETQLIETLKCHRPLTFPVHCKDHC